MGIGTRIQYTEVPISAGNVLSDGTFPLRCIIVLYRANLGRAEPGYYADGKFGIRIESKFSFKPLRPGTRMLTLLSQMP